MKAKVFKALTGLFMTLLCLFGGSHLKAESSDSSRIEDIKEVLFPDGKPIGEELSSPDIRKVKVKDFGEVYSLFIRMSNPEYVKTERRKNGIYSTYTLPNGGGYLELSKRSNFKRVKTIGVMEVNIPDIKEIRWILFCEQETVE
ncbi:MAG: hypothetical protein LBH34_04570 [Prevotellaceae bacterium]|jgi:hypothetical protein|nr:hypothetical protein [Prevotellaceae bacterium]